MADDLDRAAESSEMYLNAALHKRQKNAKPLRWVGYCHNCHEPMPQGQNFCDTDCRDDWDLRQRKL